MSSLPSPVPARLMESFGGWVTEVDIDDWNDLQRSDLRAPIFSYDTVAVLGATAGLGLWLRPRVNSMILVTDIPHDLEKLRMNFDRAVGATIEEMCPIDAFSWVLRRYHPSIAVLNLGGAEHSPQIVATLANLPPDLDVLAIIYDDHGGDRTERLDKMLLYHWERDKGPSVWNHVVVYQRRP